MGGGLLQIEYVFYVDIFGCPWSDDIKCTYDIGIPARRQRENTRKYYLSC